MGTEMRAWVEYDEQYVSAEPFANDINILCVTSGEDGLNTGSKSYAFFGAVAGVRNVTGIPPLFEPRGLPSPLSSELIRADNLYHLVEGIGTGWLFLREIQAALRHQRVSDDRINTEILVILDLMTVLERRFGADRTRLIFNFW